MARPVVNKGKNLTPILISYDVLEIQEWDNKELKLILRQPDFYSLNFIMKDPYFMH